MRKRAPAPALRQIATDDFTRGKIHLPHSAAVASRKRRPCCACSGSTAGDFSDRIKKPPDLAPGDFAAHAKIRLLLLPSGPDKIHGMTSHETRWSSIRRQTILYHALLRIATPILPAMKAPRSHNFTKTRVQHCICVVYCWIIQIIRRIRRTRLCAAAFRMRGQP